MNTRKLLIEYQKAIAAIEKLTDDIGARGVIKLLRQREKGK